MYRFTDPLIAIILLPGRPILRIAGIVRSIEAYYVVIFFDWRW